MNLTRRKFFFLGLGIMGGKVMYPMIEIPKLQIWEPTQKQIDWLRNGDWNDATHYMIGRKGGKTGILEREIVKLIREGKPGHKIVVETVATGCIITRYEKV